MGKISDVFYTDIHKNDCTIMQAAEFYYYYNLIDKPCILPEYEAYEENQINIRNKILGEAINNGKLQIHPKTNTTIFGISSLKNKAILVVEF